MISVYIILFLAALCTIFGIIIYFQVKGNKKTKQENTALHEAFWDVTRKAVRLQAALGKQTEVEEQADAEQKGLARTPDSDLVNRANHLFSGVPEPPRNRSRSG